MKGCHSFQHCGAGFAAIKGAQVKVSCSLSEGDGEGCNADIGGQLTMEEVYVDFACHSGQLP